MFEIRVSSEFSAAHNLRDYKGKCEKLHGHNWKVEACVSAHAEGRNGIAMDFHDLKKNLNRVVSVFDHSCLNDLKPFKKTNPTSENIARFTFQRLSGLLKGKPVRLKSVSVWESESSCATYTEE